MPSELERRRGAIAAGFRSPLQTWLSGVRRILCLPFPNMPPLQPPPPTVKGPRQAARLAKWRQWAQKSASYEKKRIITQDALWWNKGTYSDEQPQNKKWSTDVKWQLVIQTLVAALYSESNAGRVWINRAWSCSLDFVRSKWDARSDVGFSTLLRGFWAGLAVGIQGRCTFKPLSSPSGVFISSHSWRWRLRRQWHGSLSHPLVAKALSFDRVGLGLARLGSRPVGNLPSAFPSSLHLCGRFPFHTWRWETLGQNTRVNCTTAASSSSMQLKRNCVMKSGGVCVCGGG